MKLYDLPLKLHELRKRRITALFVIAAIFTTGLTATSWAKALSIMPAADESAVVLAASEPVRDYSSQILYVASGAYGYDVTLKADSAVTVRQDGNTYTCSSNSETVSALLSRLGVVPSPLETVAVDLTVDSVIEINVSRKIVYYDTEQELCGYETRRVPSAELPMGTEQVAQEGAAGVRTTVYEVVWANGRRVSREFLEETGNTAVEEIVEYGTAVNSVSRSDRLAEVRKNEDGSGTLVFESGSTINFSSARSMTATAYTTGYDGVGTITASGTVVHVGSVAVDPRVIPLGSRLYIVTNDGIVYGCSVAEDTGYGIRGDKIDLYYNSFRECINFGRRSCTVYILK